MPTVPMLTVRTGMLNHLLSRHYNPDGDVDPTISIATLIIMLPFYFLLASLSFGLQLPSGNFVPGIAIGATLGRLFGLVLTPGLTPCPHSPLHACTRSHCAMCHCACYRCSPPTA